MVDFNNDSTVGRPPKDIVALIIIEKLYNYLEADEMYAKQRLGGAGATISIPRARLRNLFLVAHSMMKRKLPPGSYDKLKSICLDLNNKAVKEEDLLDCFLLLHSELDSVGLIKLDTRQQYNTLNIEESNKAQGYS